MPYSNFSFGLIIREKRSQFPQRGNCCSALRLAPVRLKSYEPCPLAFRDVFLNHKTLIFIMTSIFSNIAKIWHL